jgi:dTDP-4-amino-4,6-dideoxygalactose transaminase
MNTRLDELQAAILRVKLRYLDDENRKRQQIARQYDEVLAGTDLVRPESRDTETHVYHQYVVRSQCRDHLRESLGESSVGTLIHYPVPVHLQPAYQSRVMLGDGGLPRTEQACREILSLPLYPQMTDRHLEVVVNAISHWQAQTVA